MKSLLAKYSLVLQKDNCYSFTMLLLRLVLGTAMILHGWGKIQNPFSWMGPDAPVPGFLQALAALSEVGGGLAWILGLLTPLASFGILCTMAVAAMTHMNRGDAFVGPSPTSELAVIYFLIALHILLNGPGKFSADYKIFRR